MIFEQLPHPTIFAFVVSCAISLLMVAIGNRSPAYMRKSDLNAVQSSHTKETLRLGGLGIAAALLLIAASQGQEWATLQLMLMASAPVFFSGLLEDLGYNQSPKMRLAMAMVASFLAMFLTGAYLPSLGIGPFDVVFTVFAVAAAFTIFITVGVVHAFNLIDGLNGLSGITAATSCASFLAIAHMAGAENVALVASVLLAGMLGFLTVNYPHGRLFLGDSGAYLVGFLLAWMAVVLVHQTGTVAPWAMTLVLFWPLAETAFTIVRRFAKRQKAMHPDRMHFHQVVMRGIEISVLGRRDRRVSNPLATAVLTPFLIMPPLAAILLWNRPAEAMMATLGFCLLFVTTYVATVRTIKSTRARRKPDRVAQVPLVPRPATHQKLGR